MSTRSKGRGIRHVLLAALTVFGLLAATSCTPQAPATEPTPAKAVLSPTSGPAGSFINVAAPNDACTSPGPYAYTSMQAALTIAKNGIVISQAYQYIGPSPSTYTTPDPYVRLRVPPATAPGKYLVYLSCYAYLDTYQFAPATFTVTPSL